MSHVSSNKCAWQWCCVWHDWDDVKKHKLYIFYYSVILCRVQVCWCRNYASRNTVRTLLSVSLNHPCLILCYFDKNRDGRSMQTSPSPNKRMLPHAYCSAVTMTSWVVLVKCALWCWLNYARLIQCSNCWLAAVDGIVDFRTRMRLIQWGQSTVDAMALN
jgi:hypothetical protein